MYNTGKYTAHTQNVQWDIAHTHTPSVCHLFRQSSRQPVCLCSPVESMYDCFHDAVRLKVKTSYSIDGTAFMDGSHTL